MGDKGHTYSGVSTAEYLGMNHENFNFKDEENVNEKDNLMEELFFDLNNKENMFESGNLGLIMTNGPPVPYEVDFIADYCDLNLKGSSFLGKRFATFSTFEDLEVKDEKDEFDLGKINYTSRLSFDYYSS